MRSLSEQQIVSIAVYYDPLPTSKTPEEIGKLRSYCTGGGFTDQCDGVTSIFRVLIPPEIRWGERYSYTALEDSDIVADTWGISSGMVQIEADVRQYVVAPGVYTVTILSENDGTFLLTLGQYPITVENTGRIGGSRFVR